MGPKAQHQQHRREGTLVDQASQEIEGGGVAPVEILEKQKEGLPLGERDEPTGHRGDRRCALHGRVCDGHGVAIG